MNINNLKDTYYVIAAKGVSNIESYEGNLRLLENELETGVKALYDSDEESVVAFLFARGSFTEEEAQAWVKEAEKSGINLAVQAGLKPRGKPTFLFGPSLAAAAEDLSFEDVRELLAEALDRGVTLANGAYRYPWLVKVYADSCIITLGAHYYRVPYTVGDDNKVTFGDMQEVVQKWEDVESVEPAPEVNASTAVTADIQHGSAPRVFSFHLREPETLPAEASEDDGLIWKEIFHVSRTVRPVSGDVLEVDQSIIDGIDDAFSARVFPHVPITASTHWEETAGIVPAYDSAGFVEKVVKEGGALYGGLNVIDEEIRARVDDGRIRDCSVYVWGDVYDRRDPDTVWPYVLVHLLLTNYPQIDDLEGFGIKPEAIAVAAASLPSGVQYTHYVEMEATMAGNTQTEQNPQTPQTPALSAEDAALLEQAKTLQAQGFSLEGAAERQHALQQKARGLEVDSIVAALEGKGKREDVTTIEGTRHYPAVITAVEKALRHKAIAASVDDEGASPVDTIVLSIVNALPKEARLALDTQPERPSREAAETDPESPYQRAGHRTEQIPADVAADIPEEAIDALIEDLHL